MLSKLGWLIILCTSMLVSGTSSSNQTKQILKQLTVANHDVKDIAVAEAPNANASVDPLPASKSVNQEFILRYRAPYFDQIPNSTMSLTDTKVSNYGNKGDKITANFITDEMISSKPKWSDLTMWTPRWYTTQAAAQSKDISPEKLILRSGAKLLLAPGSSKAWESSEFQDKLIALTTWKDWYGVIVAPDIKNQSVSQLPRFLWVHNSDVTSKNGFPSGLLDNRSKITTDEIIGIISMRLFQGEDAQAVRRLLGPPLEVEASSNLDLYLKQMRLGETWRYQRPDGQFHITFSKEGKFERWQWLIPSDKRTSFYMNDVMNRVDLMTTPLPTTMKIEPLWSNQGDLGFTFLIGGTDRVLLVNGDDGGLSGGHANSSIYAIDRKTGKKLWKREAGYGSIKAVIDSSGEHVTVASDYNLQKKKYELTIEHIRLSDGKVIWKQVKPSSNLDAYTLTSTGNMLVLYKRPWKDTAQSSLVVLDSETGKRIRKQILTGDFRIHNTGPQDPYILIEQGQMLQAEDPKTGAVKWKLPVSGSQIDNPEDNLYWEGIYHVTPLQPMSSTRWMLLGSQWRLLNTVTGKSAAEYPANPQDRFEAIGERYLLIQRDFNKNTSETVWYDINARREQWILPGKASHAVLEGNKVYLVLNGLPAAIDRDSGRVLWQMKSTAATPDVEDPYITDLPVSRFGITDHYLLLAYGSDLIAMRKDDGKLLGRFNNVLMGFAEARGCATANGMLNRSGDQLYVGSSNGGFKRYRVSSLDTFLETKE